MNKRSKSDLLFEEAVERLSRITRDGEFTDDIERAVEALNMKTDEDEDPPLLIF